MVGEGEGGLTFWKSGETMALGSEMSRRGLRSLGFESGSEGGTRSPASGPMTASGFLISGEGLKSSVGEEGILNWSDSGPMMASGILTSRRGF